MYDPLNETEGCDILARLFKARGYRLQRNVRFREYGVEFDIDGWDPGARVGFEYLSSEDDDHDDLSLVEYQALMDQQRRGELSLFIIDEVEPISAADLLASADEFLDEVEAARKSRRGRRPVAKKARAKPAGKQAKQPARKPAAKRTKPGAAAAPARAAKKAPKRR
jgi:hypothetical protein